MSQMQTKHIYPGGKLCLFQPHIYNTRMSILDIRNLAVAWTFARDIYEETGKWPAAEAD